MNKVGFENKNYIENKKLDLVKHTISVSLILKIYFL